MFDLKAVQQSLCDFGLDGWLFYDFRGSNILARRVLGLDQKADGEPPVLLLRAGTGRAAQAGASHRDGRARRSCRARRSIYLRWQDLEAGVAQLLKGSRRVAMEYAPRVSNPYISRVDAGTIEFVRSLRGRSRLIGRPDPAIRGDLGRFAVADAP